MSFSPTFYCEKCLKNIFLTYHASCLTLSFKFNIKRKQFLFLEGMVMTSCRSIFSQLKLISHFFLCFVCCHCEGEGQRSMELFYVPYQHVPWHLVALVSSPDGPQRTLIYEPIIGFPINICQNNTLVQTNAFFIYSYKRALNFQQRIAYHQKHSINESNLWRHSSRACLLKGYGLF